jgi:hypothetical protein
MVFGLFASVTGTRINRTTTLLSVNSDRTRRATAPGLPMSSSYRVQTDPRAKRTYRLAKFRDPVPALSDPSTTVKMTPKTGELGEQEWGLDFGGDRPFNGTRERVSGIGGKQSGYVLFRVDPSTGVLTVLPVSEWYDFRHDAMSIA